MKDSKPLRIAGVAFLVLSAAIGSSLAQPGDNATTDADGQKKEKRVVVTGSLIPQKVKVKRIGTATASNIRVIDRREIDLSGRYTSAGAIAINDPSVRIIGH